MWDVKPGDKVMVKKNFALPPNQKFYPPKALRLNFDTVYTVRDVDTAYAGTLGMVVCIRLVEVVNEAQLLSSGPGMAPVWMEPLYILAAFEKLVNSESMETLRAFLTNPNKKIEEKFDVVRRKRRRVNS